MQVKRIGKNYIHLKCNFKLANILNKLMKINIEKRHIKVKIFTGLVYKKNILNVCK